MYIRIAIASKLKEKFEKNLIRIINVHKILNIASIATLEFEYSIFSLELSICVNIYLCMRVDIYHI